MVNSFQLLPHLLSDEGDAVLDDWIRVQLAAPGRRPVLMSEKDLREQSREFIDGLTVALESGAPQDDLSNPAWSRMREFLVQISRSRALQGFTPSETATFVLSLKRVLFERLSKAAAGDPAGLADEIWLSSDLLDRMSLWTMDTYQKSREEIIARQQQELLELSTPVVRLWDEILALPIIGTLDSARTQIVMESLLQEIVSSGASIAIIDITGVPTVDTLVAQHLLKTVAAARLMGADCIISGIRPQIAQTIVHLGVELNDVVTRATLADAFSVALGRLGRSVRRIGEPTGQV